MKRLSLTSLSCVLCVGVAGLLTGCSANFAMPDAAASSFGGIQGSNYGGHAPIVGAHVFLLQAGTSGYGGASTSLLGASETGGVDFYGNTFPTLQDTITGSPTNGDYYVTTDSFGVFNLTGTGYTCTPGLPVYLYAQGGNPQTNPASGFNVTVTGATITGPVAGLYTISFTTSGTNLLYQGETLNMSGFTGNFGTYINGTQQVVLADTNLTTNSFDVSVGSLTHNGVTLTTGAQTGAAGTVTQAAPTIYNQAIVNLAVLGICPDSGTANFSQLPFVYMNEVSTAAAAYALGGFFPSPGASGLANAGAVAANLSIPASDSLALVGLQNAALTADQIYDIQGTDVGTGADGETHIARTTTPGVAVYGSTTSGSKTVSISSPIGLQVGVTITGTGIPANTTITAINTAANPDTITLSANATATGTNVLLRAGAGSGTVPQSLLNTIGNILANCVDSANTYSPVYYPTGTASTQCTTLFADAKSAGTSGTSPIDTASAAIDIAHNPWANVTALVQLPTGNEPFQPTLSAANDFSVGIEYTPAHVGYPQGIAVDGYGQVWYTNANSSSGYVTTLTPFGGVLYNQVYFANEIPTYISIDTSNNAWYGDEADQGLHKISTAGVGIDTGVDNGFINPYGIATDGNGHLFLGENNPGYGEVEAFTDTGNTAYLTTTPANPLAGVNDASCLGSTGGSYFDADHLAIDNRSNGYNLWVSDEIGDNVCIINSTTGALKYAISINGAQTRATTYSPEFIAIDGSGNAWIPDQQHNGMNKITQGGVLSHPTGATLSGAFGSAVDGAGNVWVTNRTTNNVAEFLGSTSAAVSTVLFEGGGNATVMNDPLNDAVDPSGNLWITNYLGNRIVELVGIAAPTYTPLSSAAGANKLGAKP